MCADNHQVPKVSTRPPIGEGATRPGAIAPGPSGSPGTAGGAAPQPHAPLNKAVVAAIRGRVPALAAATALSLRAGKRLSDAVHLGQEVTIVPAHYENPVQVAKKLAQVTGGQVTELVANRKCRLDSPLGVWVVELDGKVPGGAPIVEVATPPTPRAADAKVLATLETIHGIAPSLPTLGGGHIHIDGAAFLVAPKLLGRFLQLYLHLEPAILDAFRHPARSHAARGLGEFPNRGEIATRLTALGQSDPAEIAAAVGQTLDELKLPRELALNLRSLAGVQAGNKKSKGTVELRLFDAPVDVATAEAQRRLVRGLLSATFSNKPLSSAAPTDRASLFAYLDAHAEA